MIRFSSLYPQWLHITEITDLLARVYSVLDLYPHLCTRTSTVLRSTFCTEWMWRELRASKLVGSGYSMEVVCPCEPSLLPYNLHEE